MAEPTIEDLKKDLAVTEKLLAEQHRVIDAIPPCPAHGNRCVPHAIEWIERVKTLGGLILRD